MRREETGGRGTAETFRVQPEALRTFRDELLELAPQAGAASDYAKTWAELDPSGGSLMERVVDVAYNVDTELTTFFTELKTIIAGAGSELGQAANRYERLDDEAAARLDATYWSQS
ncbi:MULTISPECIES: type VII secretion target [unclassified Knoellia]|uniref:type VII secretion target n=1 Tax=Knoellia altitudinis TaxID=3404795 RepID=UPI0036100F9F